MRPHPKIRKTVKWGGAAASVLLAVVWVGTVWWAVEYNCHRRLSMCARLGWLILVVYPESPDLHRERGWTIRRYVPELYWKFDWTSNASCTIVYIPLWAFFAPLLSLTAAAWWLDRRTRRWALIGACTKCGYDRAGIAAGAVCPECGAGAVKEELNAKCAKGSKKSKEDSGT